jgi:hypothetical protein
VVLAGVITTVVFAIVFDRVVVLAVTVVVTFAGVLEVVVLVGVITTEVLADVLAIVVVLAVTVVITLATVFAVIVLVGVVVTDTLAVTLAIVEETKLVFFQVLKAEKYVQMYVPSLYVRPLVAGVGNAII